MASSLLSNAAVATTAVSRNAGAQASMVAPFNGLKSTSNFPVTKKSTNELSSLPSNGGKVQCMQVWPPIGKKKFETLSYLPPLTTESLMGEIQYLLNKGWVPCLEFELESPGYYDGRYWTMWKLPMFGCTDPAQVVNELEEAKKAYPQAFIRIIGFDNKRQVQCISFIAYKPPGFEC
ncbi:Ribulose bisphosphate carboxylase small chain 6 chloroplastic [Bienertia sinuspersici]